MPRLQLSGVIAMLSLTTLVGCSKGPALPYAVSEDVKSLGKASDDILLAFEEACPPLVTGRGNLTSITVEKGLDHMPPPELGWHKGITITFLVSDKPSGDEKWARASGHTCKALVGGGPNPGFLIAKPTCATLCSGKSMDSLFWPTVRTQMLETAEEASATEKQRLSEGDAKLKELEREALAGDYQSQRNLAYGYATGTFGSPFDPVLGCAWYATIVASENPKVNSTDHGNVKVYCEKLPRAEQDKAIQMSLNLLQQLRSASR